jgi:hypothetical protein
VNNKENVTERLTAARQAKFNQLWNELLDKISELNQVFKTQQTNRIFSFFPCRIY